MYRLSSKLKADIWYNPIFYGKFLITNGKDKIIRVYNSDSLSLHTELKERNITYIACFGDYLFADNQKDCLVYDINDFNQSPQLIVGITALPAYINEQYIYSNYKIGSEVKICKYDYLNLKRIALIDYQLSSDVKCIGCKMVFSERAFFSRKIFCINQDSGQEYWVLDVSELGKTVSNEKEVKGKIVGPLMIKDKTLLVAISNSKLIKVDIITGKLLWQKSSTNYLLQLYKDKVVNVDASFYREISSETGETLTEYEMTSEYEKYGFNVSGPLGDFTVTDTHIFIVDAMGYMMGCINRSTGKIDWSTEVGEGKVTLPHAPIVYQDKLYVLDDEGTLHAYERE